MRYWGGCSASCYVGYHRRRSGLRAWLRTRVGKYGYVNVGLIAGQGSLPLVAFSRDPQRPLVVKLGIVFACGWQDGGIWPSFVSELKAEVLIWSTLEWATERIWIVLSDTYSLNNV